MIGFNTCFSIKELSLLNSSIANFLEDLPFWLNSVNDETVKNWIKEKAIDIYSDEFYKKWNEIDISCFTQLWSSTACGWGGIGGAAMTTSYTVAVYNKHFDIIVIYWNGKLAYCVHATDNSLMMLKDKKMPGYHSLHKLELIYKPSR